MHVPLGLQLPEQQSLPVVHAALAGRQHTPLEQIDAAGDWIQS